MKTNNINTEIQSAAVCGKKEIQYSYLIRVVAILVVIIDHCFTWYCGDSISWQTYVYVFGSDSLLFFMLAGMHNLPVKTESFYSNRLIKIALPTVFFIFLYAFLDRYVFYTDQCSRSACAFFLNVLFYPPKPWFWFMYVLMGLYLIAPFVSQVIINGKQKLIEFYIVLWLLSGLYPYVETIFFQRLAFETALQPFLGYVGYMIAGWYFYQNPYRQWSVKRKVSAALFLTVGILLPVIIGLISPELDNRFVLYNVYKNNLSLNLMCLTLGVFILIQNIESLGKRIDRVIRFIDKLSFPMYLLHGFGEYLIPYFKLQDANIFVVIICISVGSIVFGQILSVLLNKLYGYLRYK